MKVFPRPADPDFVDYQLRWDWNRPSLSISRIFRREITVGKSFAEEFGESEAMWLYGTRFGELETVERHEYWRSFFWEVGGRDFATQILDLWIELDPEGWHDGYAVSENLPRRIL